ncbi:MAG: glycosyltransferase [Candidatus Saccharimonadales bacterium]
MASNKPVQIRVAIVHDWLIGGGAELVVEQLHVLFPEAPIYTSYATQEWRGRLHGKVVTGWLQPLGFMRKFIPILRIWWFTHLKFKDYDLVISSSGAEAKGIKVPKHTMHVNYCHAPTHYYWSRYDEYMKRPGFGVFNPLARLGLWLLVRPLRRWDYKAAQRPDYIVANSTHIQKEVKKYYGRDSTVVFPPVYFERFQKIANRTSERRGFVVAGRHTAYKRFDLAIVACTKLGLPLTVIGTGPDTARLKRLAGKTITFLGKVSDDVLEQELARAQALIFPGLDDFGIAPVEAMAAGTPVIAYKAGGALDYVRPGVTGEFFEAQTALSLARVLKKFDGNQYSSAAIRAWAQKFSRQAFQRNFRQALRASLAAQNKNSASGQPTGNK